MKRRFATYFKMADGEWALHVPGSPPPAPDDVVIVIVRGGDKKREVVKKVVMEGKTASICSIKPSLLKISGQPTRPRFLKQKRG